MKKEYKHIFEPFTVRRMTLKNRIMMTPMGTNYGEQSGEMSFLHINYYEQRAKGGTGLIMVENASVDSPEGSNGTTQLRIDHDNYIPRLFKLTETIHKHGTCIGIQLNHAGASAQSARTNMQPVSASNIPSKEGGEIPRPLEKDEIMRICNEKDPVLVSLGGGVKDVEVRTVDTKAGTMVIVHLLVDTGDAMGANAVNTMAEAVAPFIEEVTGGTVELRILSNLADHRLVRARATWRKEDIGGEEVVEKMLSAYAFAEADPYRAATNNKGIMNGIVPVVIATGNDTRAIESGAHAYAARSGRYTSMTTWEKDENGDLVGSIEIPMAVGLVGGATKIHPAAKAAVKLLGVKTASELGQIIACAGLANNMAAMKALATEGIQRGHMSLHARNLANTVGAKGEILEKIVAQMVADKKVRIEYAQELFDKYNSERK